MDQELWTSVLHSLAKRCCMEMLISSVLITSIWSPGSATGYLDGTNGTQIPGIQPQTNSNILLMAKVRAKWAIGKSFSRFIYGKVLGGSFDLSFMVGILLCRGFWDFERASQEEWIRDLVYGNCRPWRAMWKSFNVFWGKDHADCVSVRAHCTGFNWVWAGWIVYKVGGRHGCWAGYECGAACMESRRVVQWLFWE